MFRTRSLGWTYLPWSIGALVIALLMAAFCVNVFLAIDRHSHSVSDTLYGLFPFWTATFLLWNWVGQNTSRRTGAV